MKKINLVLVVLLFSASSMQAQLGFLFSAEGGVAGSTVKSDELPIFLASYNALNFPGGSGSPFKMKQGLATGKYFHFMVGIGGPKCKETLGFGRYLVRTKPNEARFADGSGRDITVELKDASTEVGVRFDADRLTTGFQIDVLIRTVSIYSEYVFSDGSKSLCAEHSLNGVYTNSRLQMGLGANIGFRVVPHVYLVAKCDYIFQTDKKHPEYHTYTDLNYFKSMTPDYLPRDMGEYISNPFTTENSISNDVRGLRFGFGIQVMLSTNEDE